MESDNRCKCESDAFGAFVFGFFLGGFLFELLGLCLPSVDEIREEWIEE